MVWFLSKWTVVAYALQVLDSYPDLVKSTHDHSKLVFCQIRDGCKHI